MTTPSVRRIATLMVQVTWSWACMALWMQAVFFSGNQLGESAIIALAAGATLAIGTLMLAFTVGAVRSYLRGGL